MQRRPMFLLAMAALVSLLAQPALARSGAGQTESDQQRIASQLIEMGYATQSAENMASQLTQDDLQVLLANPGMMQRAGASDPILIAVIVGVLIVAGLVVLAHNGSGSANLF